MNRTRFPHWKRKAQDILLVLLCAAAALYTLALLAGSFASGQIVSAGTRLDLDSVFVPRTGTIKLKAGAEYTLAKSKNLRSCSWVKDGTGADPIIHYTGPRDAAAFRAVEGEGPSISDVVIIGSPGTFAFEVRDNLSASRIKFTGGTGLFKIVGAAGVTRLTDCQQLATSENYIGYAGPLITRKKDLFGKVIGYSERANGAIILTRVTANLGSSIMAGVRAQAFGYLLIDDCSIADLDEHSAVYSTGKRAVKNAALRIHYGKIAEIRKTRVAGDKFLGPLNGDDGGEKLPAGPERTFKENERLELARFTDCDFDIGSFTAAPGVVSAIYSKCRLSAAGSQIVAMPFPYLTRPMVTMRFEDCVMTTSKTPATLAGNGAGAAKTTAVRGTLNGKAQ